MENSIILKSEDYKFPSKAERGESDKDYPSLKCFNFPYVSGIKSLLSDHTSAVEATRKENLYWWDMCLQNRFGSLYESYTNLITNYNRGFQDNLTKCSGNEYINKILFDYFSEIFYHYFFSTRDIIGQILNLFFSVGKNETDSFTQKGFIKALTIYDGGLFSNFINDTRIAKETRDSFTHRYSPNQPDYRARYSIENNKEIFSIGSGNFICPNKIVENIKNSLISLNTLILGLQKILKIEC